MTTKKTAMTAMFILLLFILAVILTLRISAANNPPPEIQYVTETEYIKIPIITKQVEIKYVELTPEEYADLAAEYIAKTLYGECAGCTVTEQAAVVWCILNRVDSENPFFPDDIISVVTQTDQLHGYSANNPVTPELLAVAVDVMTRRKSENDCLGDIGRVLPKEYLYFHGDGKHNHFTTEYQGGVTWDWSAESPYKEG